MRIGSELVAQAAAGDINRARTVGAEDDREAVRCLGEVVVQVLATDDEVTPELVFKSGESGLPR